MYVLKSIPANETSLLTHRSLPRRLILEHRPRHSTRPYATVSSWYVYLSFPPSRTQLTSPPPPAIEGVGTQAYAISQLGARHLLHSFYADQPAGPIDFAIRDACTNKFGSGSRLCIATSPSLFSQFKNKGDGRGDSNMHESGGGGYWRETAETRNIRYSTRLNLGELLEEKRRGAAGAHIVGMYADDENDDRQWTNWD